MRTQEYIIGSGPAPAWCRNLLMPFARGGGVAYEFHGATRDYDLNIGDKLVYKGGKIKIRRGGGQHERESIFEPSEKAESHD